MKFYRETTYVSGGIGDTDTAHLWAYAQSVGESLGITEYLMNPSDYHVTLLYSQDSTDIAIEELEPGIKFDVKRPFLAQYNHYVVIGFESDYLQGLHLGIKSSAGAEHSYPDFAPHISIAKLPKNGLRVLPEDTKSPITVADFPDRLYLDKITASVVN